MIRKFYGCSRKWNLITDSDAKSSVCSFCQSYARSIVDIEDCTSVYSGIEVYPACNGKIPSYMYVMTLQGIFAAQVKYKPSVVEES